MASNVDHGEIKLGQLLTIALSIAALVLGEPWLLVALGVAFLLAGTVRALSPFGAVYRLVVRPLGLMRSDYRLDNLQAHQFGQLVGVATVAAAWGLIQAGYPAAGWVVVGVLIALTAVSYFGWCIGCFLYYQLNRLGLRGFFGHAPTDRSVFPGRRPRKSG